MADIPDRLVACFDTFGYYCFRLACLSPFAKTQADVAAAEPV
jgi:hypothetical protein